MKKFQKILVALLILSLSFCMLFSCGENETAAGRMTLVVNGKEETVYDVSLDGIDTSKGLVAVLDALKAENKLDYGITGTMLDYVGDVKNDYEKSEYVYLYTSVVKDQDVSEYRMTLDYDGRTLVSAGIGALEMTVEDGAVIYVTTIKW